MAYVSTQADRKAPIGLKEYPSTIGKGVIPINPKMATIPIAAVR